MPRYFFNLYNDQVLIDEEGTELPDAGAAREHARYEVLEMAADSIKTHAHLVQHHRIEVVDAQGAIVTKVTFGEAVAIKE